MHIHLQFDTQRGGLVHMTLFVNGSAAGVLTMPPAESLLFQNILSAGGQILSENAAGRFLCVASGKVDAVSADEIMAAVRA